MTNIIMKPIQSFYFFVYLCLCICSFTKLASAQQNTSVPKIEIYLGIRAPLHSEKKHYYFDGTAYILDERTDIKVTKSNISPDPNIPSLYEVHFCTSNFVIKKDYSYFLKCEDKVFKINSMGGNGKIMSMVALQAITQSLAEFLTGQKLPKPPKDELEIAYEPQPSYNPGSNINVSIVITHYAQDDLSIYWGTVGDGQGKYKDAQLKFSATLNGDSVKANPNPVSDGFISHPHLFKPRTALRRNANLANWLDFTEPGIYHVTANYTIEIQNPKRKSEAIQSWKVDYQNKFDVKVAQK